MPRTELTLLNAAQITRPPDRDPGKRRRDYSERRQLDETERSCACSDAIQRQCVDWRFQPSDPSHSSYLDSLSRRAKGDQVNQSDLHLRATHRQSENIYSCHTGSGSKDILHLRKRRGWAIRDP